MKTTKGISPQTGQPFEINETEEQDSIEISMNAKGEAQVTVKMYMQNADFDDGECVVDALTAVLKKLRDEGIRIAGENRG